ncbi:MAG: glycosyltransferase family 4 protein [Bryobacteraceae bacterium]
MNIKALRDGGHPRILAVTTVDVMAWGLLKPWLTALQHSRYEVHLACSRGSYFSRLAAEGFQMHEVALRRTLNPFVHIRPLLQLYRLLRRGNFDVINAHSPVAAALGRLAACFARTRPRLYTVHGFYFHDRMPALPRRFFQAIEWLLGRFTCHLVFVSEEDRQTALRLGIVRSEDRTTTIWNGVDLNRFKPKSAHDTEVDLVRRELGLCPDRPVVGIVGRIVREKGYREFLSMASAIGSLGRQVAFLVVGDTLSSDRDQFGATFRRLVRTAGLEDRFVFTGFTEDVPKYLRMMHVFVLPSYREGFPRSVVEAMATGLPVVATDIRGCREAVVHGETGLIVPPKDARALTGAVLHLLDHPEEARRMGAAGRRRAEQLYDQRLVQERFVAVFDRLLGRQAMAHAQLGLSPS